MAPHTDIAAPMSDMGLASPNGKLKDISCRDMLRALDKAGRITLPAPLAPSRTRGGAGVIRNIDHDMTPINSALSELRPLHIKNLDSGAELDAFKSYLN